MTQAKTQAVLVSGGRVVAEATTSAKNGDVVSYGFEKAQGGNLVQLGTAKVSRAKKYLGNSELMESLQYRLALVNFGGGDCV